MKETARHQEVFEAWYGANRSFRKISEKFGIKSSTLYGWADQLEWHERADSRDAQARQKADAKAIRDAAKRLDDRGKLGSGLRLIVQNHFFKKDEKGKPIPYEFESTQAALNALKEGVALEREADGLPDFVVLALNADENEIQRKRAEVFAELERRNGLGRGPSAISDGDGQLRADGDDE